jgi:hypothetical protein
MRACSSAARGNHRPLQAGWNEIDTVEVTHGPGPDLLDIRLRQQGEPVRTDPGPVLPTVPRAEWPRRDFGRKLGIVAPKSVRVIDDAAA